jgi:hypothetical protein
MNSRQIKVLLFGACGMVGTAVLRECLADPQVAKVVAVGRTVSTLHSAKLTQVIHADPSNYDGIESSLVNFDACFFCLVVYSANICCSLQSMATPSASWKRAISNSLPACERGAAASWRSSVLRSLGS